MSLTITINNINDLTDTERAVLRIIAGDMITATVADTLKQTVRDMVSPPIQDPPPVEPEEKCSPHTVVMDDSRTCLVDSITIDPPLRFPNSDHVTVSVAPAPPAPTASPAPASAERDSAGLPWDKRIHASTRAKIANGTWRYMRAVDKELVKQVEAELRAVQAIPVPVAGITHTSSSGEDEFGSTQVLPPTPPTPTDQTNLADETVTADVPPPPVAPPPPPSSLPMTFAQLMQRVTPLLVSGKITGPVLQGIVEKVGLPYLSALGARPDLVETVHKAIDLEVTRGL